MRKDKSIILGKIKSLDVLVESNNLVQHQWQERYDLEAELEQLYSREELRLRRQSGVKWTLKGDANTNFFHGVANGRKRKMYNFLPRR
jgi:mannosylglycoprotein endo-beta-mannosidase